MTQAGIEIFRDLNIGSDGVSLDAIRASLLAVEATDWAHDEEQEGNLRQYAVGVDGEDVLVFEYVGDAFPKATLTLWQLENSYRVTNIVPSEVGQLDVKQYNDILMDFVANVIEESDARPDLKLRLTDAVRGLDSWANVAVARALRRFSALANKSTTNSHPNDHERWEEFVILAHQSQDKIPADILRRWLVEIDGWDETSSFKLAIHYEEGMSLLETYDAFMRD